MCIFLSRITSGPEESAGVTGFFRDGLVITIPTGVRICRAVVDGRNSKENVLVL